MIGWTIRILLLLLVIRLVWRFVAGLLEGLAQSPPRGGDRAVPLVRDPVCGTYVPRERALAIGSGQSVAYFCSEKCKQEWKTRSA